MRLIIAGGRSIIVSTSMLIDLCNHYKLDASIIEEIVSGNARGIDSCGENLAKEQDIPLKLFKANWKKFGKRAGMLRNGEMARYADALLLIWDGQSSGSGGMKKLMERLDKPIYEVILK